MAKRAIGSVKKGKNKGNGPSRKGGKAPWSAGIPRAMRGGTRK